MCARRNSQPAPAAEKKPVFNEYHGTKVEDDYQWLENDDDRGGQGVVGRGEQANPRLSRRTVGAGARSRSNSQRWYAKTSPSYSSIVARPGKLFAMKFQPPKQQPMLVTLDFGGRFEIGKGAGRSKQDRQQRNDCDRLVRAVARWHESGRLTLQGRERGWHVAFFRHGRRQGTR